MKNLIDFDFSDLQALVRFSHVKMTESLFLLLNISDADAAKQWLGAAPVSNAVHTTPHPDTALQIAFSVEGLRALDLSEDIIQAFSDEFVVGMSGDESRSRRLGDTGVNAPEHWQWGGEAERVPHLLLLLYAVKGGMEDWQETVFDKKFKTAFRVVKQLPTHEIGQFEPFGFTDGISQPTLDWARQQSTETHSRDQYSNLLAIGEVVLGYPNEYNQYTVRPLIDPATDALAAEWLLNAEDQPNLKDFGRNGSYLVLRQLHQDVPGFWQFLDKAAGSVPEKREQLAAAMVGRQRDGAPLLPPLDGDIPGIQSSDDLNRFNYDADPEARQCPLGSHIRRMNPRTGDLPPGGNSLFSRLQRILGFGRKRVGDDLVASARFHRILRRGRTYGERLTPEQAVKADAPVAERGLQFICLVGNICRQFEFVHNAWVMNSRFNGLQHERDPLLGNRQPLTDGQATDQFSYHETDAPPQRICGLPQFVTVRGGAYFFMPGLKALKYLAALPAKARE